MGLCDYAFGNIFATLTLGGLHHQYVRILFPAGTVTSTRVTRAAESMSQSGPTPNAVAYAVASPKDVFIVSPARHIAPFSKRATCAEDHLVRASWRAG